MKKLIASIKIILITGILSCQDKPQTVKVETELIIPPPKLGFVLEDSLDLKKISKNIVPLNTGFGKDQPFGPNEIKRYTYLKSHMNCFWAVSNCYKDTILARSNNSEQLIFGASVPKIILATAAVHNNGGRLKSENHWRQLLQVLVVSANDPQWALMQTLAGGSMSIIDFCKDWGYNMHPEKTPGNNLVSATGMVQFYNDLCQRKFKGSDAILQISNACATSVSRSKVYMPDSAVMGCKTGTWGEFIHDTGWFWWNGQYWSIAVLTNGRFSSNDVAILWGGLFREYVSGKLSVIESKNSNIVDTTSQKKNTLVKKKIYKKYKSKHKSKKKRKKK